MIRTLTALFCAAGLLAACQSAPAPNADNMPDSTDAIEAPTETATATLLDGKSFSIQVTDASGNVTSDTLSFADGSFDSTDCKQYGFSAAEYETGAMGDIVSFMVTTSSETEGTIEWNGKVVGDAISGTFDWAKEGQATANSSFAGTLN